MILFSPWNRKKKPAPRGEAEAPVADGSDKPADESSPVKRAPAKKTSTGDYDR